MSDLLNAASLIMIPSGYSEDKVYSAVPTDGNGDLSFTRSSNGTRINSSGLVEVTPWNLLEQSNTFSNGAIWGLSDATITGGQSGYDGTSNAWKLQSSGGTNTYIAQGTFSGLRTQSIYAKAGNTSKFSIIVGGYGNGMQFDLSNGTIVTNSNSSYFSGSITSVGSGWYYIVVTIQATAPTYAMLVAPQNLSSGGITLGDYVFIQNAQLNIGSTAKPYFPTTDRLNVPRLTYQNGGGGCPILLLEKQSTNLALYSEQFDNAGWGKSNITVTANDAISPDGTQNADKITSTNASNTMQVAVSSSSGVDYTISVFAKNIDAGNVRLDMSNVAFGPVFTFATKTFTTVSGWTTSYQEFSNGWFRLIATRQSNSTSASPQFGLDSVVGSVYLWGAQFEQSTYPTSYIPTTSASATRVADAIGNQTTSIAQAFTDNSKGTIFFDLRNIKFGGADAARFRFGDSSSNLQFALYIGPIGVGVYSYKATAGFVISQSTTSAQKLAVKFDGNTIVGFSNGVKRNTITASSSFSIDQMTDNDTGDLCWEKNQFILFNAVLTDAECISLTTI